MKYFSMENVSCADKYIQQNFSFNNYLFLELKVRMKMSHYSMLCS